MPHQWIGDRMSDRVMESQTALNRGTEHGYGENVSNA